MSDELKNLLPAAPAIFQVRGSKINDARVSGAPSVKYPIIRDLATVAKQATIRIEIDTASKRYEGAIHGLGDRGNGQQLYVDTGGTRNAIALDKIIAFRVLAIEVPADIELPIVL